VVRLSSNRPTTASAASRLHTATRSIHEADHEAKCTIQTLDGGAQSRCFCALAVLRRALSLSGLLYTADDMEDLRFPSTLTNTVIIEVRLLSELVPHC
jgi:hypothetical protein